MEWRHIAAEELPSVDEQLSRAAETALSESLPPNRWSPELQLRFESSLRQRKYEANRFVLWLALAVTILSVFIDYATIPDHVGYMFMARLGLVLPLQVAGLLLPPKLLRWQKLATGLSLVNFAAILLSGAQWASPVTGAYMAIGPVLMLGIATPILPFSPREVRILLVAFATAVASVALLSGAQVLHDPAFVGITCFTVLLCLIVPHRIWALHGRNFLLNLQSAMRMGELGESNAKLVEMSRQDPLTGLANRRHATETFKHHFAATPAMGEARPAAMMLDLDRFKGFNDNWGHQTGDDCLRAAAEEMRFCAAQHGGLAARFGGEEFVILFRALDEREAFSTADELRRAIELIEIKHAGSKDTATCTVSIGVALHEAEQTPELAPLLARADAALYAAKRKGRNRTVMAD